MVIRNLNDLPNVQVPLGSIRSIPIKTAPKSREFDPEVRGVSSTEYDDTFYFPLFGDGTAGNIRFQSSLLLASVVPEVRDVGMDFYNRTGAPLSVALGQQGQATHFDLAFSGGRVFSAQTPGTGDLQVGHAVVKVQRPASVAGSGDVYAQSAGDTGEIRGTVVFTRADGGITVTEAGIPAARPLRDFTVLLDSIGAKDTGLALVNPGGDDTDPGSPATLFVRVWDQAFTHQLGEVRFTLEPGEAIGQFVWEIFQENGASADLVTQLQETEAVVTVESDVPVAALTLRQNDDAAIAYPEEVPILTAFPVIPGRADTN